LGFVNVATEAEFEYYKSRNYIELPTDEDEDFT
jgi:hypothetical protein